MEVTIAREVVVQVKGMEGLRSSIVCGLLLVLAYTADVAHLLISVLVIATCECICRFLRCESLYVLYMRTVSLFRVSEEHSDSDT